MSSLAPAIIVFERRPCWESELKRRLPPTEVLVRPCRSAADALALARAMPGSVLVVDLGVATESVLRLLEIFSVLRLPVTSVVMSPASTADLEWPLRELGAIAFLPETISGNDLADLCRRLLHEHTSARKESGNRDAMPAAGHFRTGDSREDTSHSAITSTKIGSPGSF